MPDLRQSNVREVMGEWTECKRNNDIRATLNCIQYCLLNKNVVWLHLHLHELLHISTLLSEKPIARDLKNMHVLIAGIDQVRGVRV